MICQNKDDHDIVVELNSNEVETRHCKKCDMNQYFWCDPNTGASGWKNVGHANG